MIGCSHSTHTELAELRKSDNPALLICERQRDAATARAEAAERELAFVKGRKVTLPKTYSMGDYPAMIAEDVVNAIRAAGVEVAP